MSLFHKYLHGNALGISFGAKVQWLSLHSTNPEPRFCTGSNQAREVSEICYGENLWQ